MKSLLEMDYLKLFLILFVFVLFILPIFLLIIGVDIENWWYPALSVLALLLFFFIIYPKITKNKRFLKESKESKQTAKIIRQRPDLFKIRIGQIITLFLIIILSGYFIYKNQLETAGLIAVVIVFSFMIYYSKWIQKDKKTLAYGKKLENLEKKNLKTIVKIRIWGFIVGIIILLIWAVIFFITFYKK